MTEWLNHPAHDSTTSLDPQALSQRCDDLARSTQELQRKYNELSMFVETAAIGLHWVDGNGIIIWANEADMRLLGYTRDEYIGRPIADFHVDRSVIDEILPRLLRGERLRQFEARLRCKDGSTRHVLIDSSGFWEDGRFIHTQCFVVNVTHRRHAEESFLKGEQRFTRFMQHLPGLAWIKDVDGHYVFVNDAAERAFGRSLKEIYGATDLQLFPPEIAARFREDDRRALASGAGIEVIETMEHRDGLHQAIVSKFPISGPDGTPALVGGIAIDITEWMHAERALRESEERYRQVVSGLPAAVYTCDARGRVMMYNEAAVTLWGRKPELGRDTWCGSLRMYTPEGRLLPLEQCPMAIALKGSLDIPRGEIIIERPDGTRRNVLPHPAPILDATGAVIGAVNMLVDITDRKSAESELAATKDILARQVDTLMHLHQLAMRLSGDLELRPALQAILVTLVELHAADYGLLSLYDPETGLLCVETSYGLDDASLAQFSGMRPDASAGAVGAAFVTKVRTIIEDVEADPRFETLSPVAATVGFRAVHSTPILTRSGEILGVLSLQFKSRRQPTQREMQLADVCARHAADIVETKRNQQALRESEERFRSMADTAPAMLWKADAHAGCVFLSRGWYEFTGRTEADSLGFAWLDAIHPEDRPAVRDRLLTALLRREPFAGDYRLRRADGQHRWVIDTGRPRFDAGGKFLGYIGAVIDITDRKHAETELTHAKDTAEAASRAKDTFLAVLSHELRTPLTPVLMAVTGMEADASLPPRVRDDISMIRRNVELETKLIDDLLDLSRITAGKIRLQPRPLSLNAAVRHVCEICRAQFQEKAIHLHCDLNDAVGHVSADPARLQQVLWNVLKNAAKFTPEGGDVYVSTYRGEAGPVPFVSSRNGSNDTNASPSLPARWCISVRDTGIGIASDNLARIFDAFEQGDAGITRQFGGLGLGLAISKALVDLHRGSIHVESQGLHMGSTFTIELPATQPAPEKRPVHAADNGNGQLQSLRLLVVEDHVDTARVLQRMLQTWGYQVSTAGSVAAALELVLQQPFDIMVSDVGLPDATGYELMQRIRELRPIKGIAMSGYGMDEDLRKSRAAGFIEHLVKPVDVLQLKEAIQRVAENGD